MKIQQLKVFIALGILFIGIMIAQWLNLSPNAISIEVVSPEQEDTYQLFYDLGRGLNEGDSLLAAIQPSDTTATVTFQMDEALFTQIRGFRIDPGTRPGLVRITAIRIQHEFSISRFRFSLYHWIDDQLLTDFRPLHDITAFTLNAPELTLTLSGNDPHFEFCGDWERIQESITHVQRQMAFLFSSLSFAAAAMIYGILYFFRTTSDRFFKKILAIMQWVLLFIKDIYDKRYTIYELTRRDFKSMYTGSLLGLTWSFVQPLAMTGVLWFVFSKGFRALPIENVPFIVWMLCGLVPWYFFSNCLVTNTSVLMEYGYLVKKTNFRVSILPIVKILSALIVHAIFIGILLIFLFAYRMPVSIYWLQVFYYIAALMFFLLGMSWVTSSINVFLKDVAQMINVLMQFGFWLTPILWDYHILPKNYEILLKLNPMFYVVQGYRNSFIYQTPFWWNPKLTIYFWGITVLMLFAGILIYKRLRPHFADVI